MEEVLPTLHNVSVVFTSPPYNLGGAPWPHRSHWKPGHGSGGHRKWRNGSDASHGVIYHTHKDALPHDVYVAWQHQVLKLCWDALTDQGVIFYNHKPRVIGSRLWVPLELNPGLPLRQIVIWARAGGMNFNPTAYVPMHEWIMIFAKPAWRLRSKGASGAGDVWYVPQQANPDHPAPFPAALPMRALETLTPGLTVDPFMGTGATGVACVRLQRPFVGIELDQQYFHKACQSIENAYKQLNIFVPPPPPPRQEALL